MTMLLAALFLASLAIGTARIGVGDVLQALRASDGSYEHVVVLTLRLPRALAALLIGSALAAAGAVMQGLTQNPLASPGLLGINAGAAFAVVLAALVFGGGSLALYAVASFIGAAVAAVCVTALGSFGSGGPTPLKLTLAGAVFSAFVGSLTAAILLADANTLDEVRLWTVGSLAGRQMDAVRSLAPIILCGLAAAMAMGRRITTQSLGAEITVALGQRTQRVRLAGALVVIVLAGSAVSLAGPVGFVGLVAPHLARFVAGSDYRMVIPFSALIGALVVLAADVAARLAFAPEEIPIGVVMALVGAPFFLYLARYKVGR